MKQSKVFVTPVLKNDNSGTIIQAGDPLTLVLRDRSTTKVHVTGVERGGRKVSWNLTALATLTAVLTSSQNATAAASDDSTGDALANAIKASYNALQVDIAALFTSSSANLGSPTSAQNATTAASNDATRLALANALRTNLNASQVDIAEVFAKNPALGAPTSIQIATPIGSDDPTTQTLLNAMKTQFNAQQVDVAEAFTKLDNGYFQPRSEDVVAVNGDHQKSYAASADLHDEGSDAEEMDPVISVGS